MPVIRPLDREDFSDSAGEAFTFLVGVIVNLDPDAAFDFGIGVGSVRNSLGFTTGSCSKAF